jgi:hypothetical protein
MKTKICTKCKIEKETNQFNNDKTTKDKLHLQCKECLKEYRINNKQRIKEYNKEYKINNKNYYKNYSKEYYENNKEIILKCKRENFNKRMQLEPLFKLSNSIRSTFHKVIKRNGYVKKSKSISILGCSFEEFKIYLEKQFQPWMNWNNYGKYNGELNYGWDIDHIIPISSANTEDDIIKLNHYTNLQPLCSYTNRYIKTNKTNI